MSIELIDFDRPEKDMPQLAVKNLVRGLNSILCVWLIVQCSLAGYAPIMAQSPSEGDIPHVFLPIIENNSTDESEAKAAAGPVAAYALNEGAGTAVTDSSANHRVSPMPGH